MSYILEALKRSQQERELGKVPGLAATPPAMADPPAGHRLLPLALVLAALSLLLALYALVGRESGQRLDLASPPAGAARTSGTTGVPPAGRARTAGAPQANEERGTPAPAVSRPARGTPSPTPAPSPAGAPGPTPVVTKGQPERPSALQLRRELLAVRRMLERREGTSAAAKRTPVTARENGTGNKVPVPPVVAATTPEPRLPGLARTLPPAVRKRLPERRLTVLSYADSPALRFVILNSERLEEGATSRDGLAVVRIRPGGVILEFQGQRFFQPL